jgi:hypothetical protein
MTNQRNRSELTSGRVGLSWQDDERIQTYVSVGHDLVQKTPLGHQLECFRDNVRIQGMPSTHPPGDWGYGSTAYARARETALRLWDTERLSAGALGTLWAYCSPLALSLEGLPGSKREEAAVAAGELTVNRGRLFAVYPRTELGRTAQRGEDVDARRLLGPRECRCEASVECSCFARHALARRLYAECASSRGDARKVWNEIHRQAEALLRAAFEAWAASRAAEDERRFADRERRRHGAKAGAVTTATSES